MGMVVTVAKRVVLAALGLPLLVLFVGQAGCLLPFSPVEITRQKPYADFVGREYRVVSDVSAYAWNDFPDKDKILSVSLTAPPGVRNRFVSYVTPLRPGQRVRIVSAWRLFHLFFFRRYYAVLVPGAGLREDVQIRLYVNSDGIPDPRVYEPVGE